MDYYFFLLSLSLYFYLKLSNTTAKVILLKQKYDHITHLLKNLSGSHQEDEQLSKDVFNYLYVKSFDPVEEETWTPVRGPGSIGQVYLGMNERQNNKEQKEPNKKSPCSIRYCTLYTLCCFNAQKIHEILGQILPEIDSERKMCAQEFHWEVFVKSTPVESEGHRTEQREKLNSIQL